MVVLIAIGIVNSGFTDFSKNIGPNFQLGLTSVVRIWVSMINILQEFFEDFYEISIFY